MAGKWRKRRASSLTFGDDEQHNLEYRHNLWLDRQDRADAAFQQRLRRAGVQEGIVTRPCTHHPIRLTQER